MPYTDDGAYVVITDGIVFRCYIEAVGSKQERRWIFDTRDTRYIGPPAAVPIIHEIELIQLVNEWWAEKKALGQA